MFILRHWLGMKSFLWQRTIFNKTQHPGWDIWAELKEKWKVQQCISLFRMFLCSRNNLNMPTKDAICGPRKSQNPNCWRLGEYLEEILTHASQGLTQISVVNHHQSGYRAKWTSSLRCPPWCCGRTELGVGKYTHWKCCYCDVIASRS